MASERTAGAFAVTGHPPTVRALGAGASVRVDDIHREETFIVQASCADSSLDGAGHKDPERLHMGGTGPN